MKRPARPAAVFSALLFFLVTPSIHSASEIRILGWDELSDRKLTETGSQAFKLYGDAWKHAETAHFVYHFRDEKTAETVLVHAETYYGWVKQLFGAGEEPESRKSHVFVFGDKEVWRSFNARTPEKLPGAEAFTNGFELFLYREPFYLEPQRVLAHEITHLVLFRFVKGDVPLFLNEGFAEYMATKAIAMKADGNEYSVRIFQKIPESDFIPLEDLASMRTYPAGREEVFYRESELFTRFLVLNHPASDYHSLLEETAAGKPFELAVMELYGMDLDEISEKFRLYAMTR